MIFSEAFLPAARRLFHKPIRFPIADAHYAMGFAALHRCTGERAYFERMGEFLEALQATRSAGFEDYCWGYPFDWVTRGGVLAEGTPFITSTPYMWEAFQAAHAPRTAGRLEGDHGIDCASCRAGHPGL